MTGSLIALIGTSSVGKSTVASELQPLLSEPYLVVGIDLFLNMFPQHWRGSPRGPGEGMWYDDTTDSDGSPRARIGYGPAGARLLAGMRTAVRAMLYCGNNVLLDEMPLDETILPAWQNDLTGYSATWIRLHAPLEIVEARERQRTRGQKLGNARGHFHITQTGDYDLEVDVSTISPSEAAAEVLTKLATLRTKSKLP